MYFDDALEEAGVGWYQVMLLMYQMATALTAIDSVIINFAGGTQEHWCQIPALQNFSHAQQKYISIPDSSMSRSSIPDDGQDLKYERCYRLPLEFDNHSTEELLNWNRTLRTAGIKREEWIKCDQGWVYDKSIWISTINSQWDLVCDDSWKTAMTNTLLMAGWLTGAFIVGPTSDKYGRKLTLLLCHLLRIIGSYMCLYAPNYEVFCVGRFIAGLFFANTTLCCFVILQEVSPKDYRATFGTLVYTIGSFGGCTLGLIAYFHRDHFLLMATYIWPLIFIVPFFWFGMDESPRWLMSKGKDEEAIRILTKIAKVNKGPDAKLPEELHFREELDKQSKQEKGTYMDLFKTPNLRKRMFIIGFCWFNASIVTYGLGMNVGRLAGDVFLNFIIMAFFDIPARIISIPIIGCIGRRWGNTLFFGSAGLLMMVCIPFILDESLGLAATILSILGKALNGMGFIGMYTFTGELSSTTIRNQALSFGSVCARVSGMAAPFVGGPLGEVWDGLPNVVFGAFGLTAACLIYFLPETLGHNLPETVAEAEAFGNKHAKTNTTCLPPLDEVCTSENPKIGEQNGGFMLSTEDTHL